MLVMNYNSFNFSAFNAFSTLQEIEQHLEWDLNPNNDDNSEDGDNVQCHFMTLVHFYIISWVRRNLTGYSSKSTIASFEHGLEKSRNFWMRCFISRGWETHYRIIAIFALSINTGAPAYQCSDYFGGLMVCGDCYREHHCWQPFYCMKMCRLLLDMSAAALTEIIEIERNTLWEDSTVRHQCRLTTRTSSWRNLYSTHYWSISVYSHTYKWLSFHQPTVL